MQIDNVVTLSCNFTGPATALLHDVDQFLNKVKASRPDKSDFNLVHALVFSKQMSHDEVVDLNQGLSDLYKRNGFSVLGGDTSAGNELSVFISTIVF